MPCARRLKPLKEDDFTDPGKLVVMSEVIGTGANRRLNVLPDAVFEQTGQPRAIAFLSSFLLMAATELPLPLPGSRQWLPHRGRSLPQQHLLAERSDCWFRGQRQPDT